MVPFVIFTILYTELRRLRGVEIINKAALNIVAMR